MKKQAYALASQIYNAWSKGNMQQFLQDKFNISFEQAQKIEFGYKGIKPVDIFDVIDDLRWGQVFPLLGLQLNSKKVWPKNILGWYVLQKIYGKEIFDWKIFGQKAVNYNNKIDFPSRVFGIDGKHMPFGLAALEIVEFGKLPAHVQKKLVLSLKSWERLVSF